MPGTTLGVIPLRAFEGRGAMYDTPGVFLHHRLNSISERRGFQAIQARGSLRRFEPPPRVEGEETGSGTFAGLSLLWGAAASRGHRRGDGERGPGVLRTQGHARHRGGDRVAAGRARGAGRGERGEGGSERAPRTGGCRGRCRGRCRGCAPLAPSAAAAVEAARAERARRPALEDALRRRRRLRGRTISSFREHRATYETARRRRRACFIQRLVREARFDSREGEDGYGALADVSVSGMNGWIRVTRVGHSRGDAAPSRVKVWGPRGLEVFVREPMPIGGA